MLLRGLIGKVLRRTRLGQNRTLRDVAEAARVSVPYLSEVERGRKEPSSELLAAICTALDLELTDLLSEVRFEIARDRLAQLGLSTRPTGSRPAAERPVTARPVNGHPINGHAISSGADILGEPLSADHEPARNGSVSVGSTYGGAFDGSLGGSFGGSFGSVMVAA